jgi:quercetin dioxygenase-like cupin family protein
LLAELGEWGKPYLLTTLALRTVEEMRTFDEHSTRRPEDLVAERTARDWLERTEGVVAVIEATVAPGTGPPLHAHPSLDERFYVLAGRLTFRIGEASFTALPGASVVASPGAPHTYTNQSGEVARVLLVFMLAGAETSMDDGAHHTEIVGPPL